MTKNLRKEKEGDNMKFIEKKEFLINNFPNEFVNARFDVFNSLSSKQSIFCVCGKLATSLHERNCKKFNNLVDKETVKKLEHLIKDN